MSNSVKCLMIGQAGIGKTTFLNNFPNSKLQLDPLLDRENFSLQCLNEKFEAVNIDIENCDVTLETCLHDTDLVINNKVIPSNKIINTCNYKIIILCFAMDDSHSFELIKSKWEIDMKKNKKSKHLFILLGLKSDTVANYKANGCSINDANDDESMHVLDKIDNRTKQIKIKKYKKRSSSITSNSSTSKLNKRNRNNSETDNANIPIAQFKKFAKTIGSNYFLQYSNRSAETGSVDTDNKSPEKVSFYDKFIRNILKSNKKSEKANLNDSTELNVSDAKEDSSVKAQKPKSKSKIPKSISAPIKLIQNHKAKKLVDPKVVTLEAIGDQNEANLNQHTNSVVEDNLVDVNNNSNNTVTNDLPLNKNDKLDNFRPNETFSVKKKLSRFVIEVGTYVVTCGGSRSRKLVHLRELKNGNGGNGNINNRLLRKNKSWLLLSSSEMSLNSLDNDNAFAS